MGNGISVDGHLNNSDSMTSLGLNGIRDQSLVYKKAARAGSVLQLCL